MIALQLFRAHSPIVGLVSILRRAWFESPLLVCAAVALVAFRLAISATYPLSDNTEARYAELARAMVASGDWVTLRLPGGIPFWGKPPLSTWASAVGVSVWGANEWGVRLPSVAMALIVSLIVGAWALALAGVRAALIAVCLLWASTAFFVGAGAVMTDMALTFGVVMALAGFRLAIDRRRPACRVIGTGALFVGLALGLLAKGPIAGIFSLVPIVIIGLLNRETLRVTLSLTWLRGGLITLALAAPWYLLSEVRTPGFLEYFFVGEHWKRFTQPGWDGDLYGTAHQQPRGLIWLYLLGGILPWAALLPWLLLGRQISVKPNCCQFNCGSLDTRLLLTWAFVPLAMFTFSRNILWTYVLPALPPLMILLGSWVSADPRRNRADVLICAGLASTLILSSAMLLWQYQRGGVQSAKSVLAEFRTAGHDFEEVAFLGAVPYSASFYSAGRARNVVTLHELIAWSTDRPEAAAQSAHQQHRFVVLPEKVWLSFDPLFRRGHAVMIRKGGYVLLELPYRDSQRIRHQRMRRMAEKDSPATAQICLRTPACGTSLYAPA